MGRRESTGTQKDGMTDATQFVKQVLVDRNLSDDAARDIARELDDLIDLDFEFGCTFNDSEEW